MSRMERWQPGESRIVCILIACLWSLCTCAGIAPCLQVIDEIVSNPADKTQVSVVVANVTPADILLKERFDELASNKNVKVTYVVDKVPAGEKFNGPVGHVTADLLSKTLPKPAADSLVRKRAHPMRGGCDGTSPPRVVEGR